MRDRNTVPPPSGRRRTGTRWRSVILGRDRGRRQTPDPTPARPDTVEGDEEPRNG